MYVEEENGLHREIGTICVFRCPLRVLELLYSSCAILNFWTWHFLVRCVHICVCVCKVWEGPQTLPAQCGWSPPTSIQTNYLSQKESIFFIKDWINVNGPSFHCHKGKTPQTTSILSLVVTRVFLIRLRSSVVSRRVCVSLSTKGLVNMSSVQLDLRK